MLLQTRRAESSHPAARTHLRLKGARKSFSWKDYRDLLVRAHIQFGGSIVVIWDNLNTHLTEGLKQYEADMTGSPPSVSRPMPLI